MILNDKILDQIPDTDPVRVSVPKGTHRLVLQRRGYEWIEQTIEVGRGDRVSVKLTWKPETVSGGGISPTDEPPEENAAPQ